MGRGRAHTSLAPMVQTGLSASCCGGSLQGSVPALTAPALPSRGLAVPEGFEANSESKRYVQGSSPCISYCLQPGFTVDDQ